MKKLRCLLHICCAPDATWVIELLRPGYEVSGFFYNPNIEPEEEYELRWAEAVRLARRYRISLYEGEYEIDYFRILVSGFEAEPEGGKRCERCYQMRLERTAQFAKEHGYDCFTTTLSISPHKRAETINQIGIALAQKYGVKFLAADFKKKDGFKRSIELSKAMGLYRQDYCGCSYSKQEREAQRTAKLSKLISEIRSCRVCHLPEESYPIFEGNSTAQILIVGQAPGRHELETGSPFSGPAGNRLFRWFEAIGYKEEAVRNRSYITAMARCYPGRAQRGDRPPTPEMLKNCRKYLDAELMILRPRLIIPVGKLAIQYLLGRHKLDLVVGRRFRSQKYGFRSVIIPLPHPSGINIWSFRKENQARIRRALKLLKSELEL